MNLEHVCLLSNHFESLCTPMGFVCLSWGVKVGSLLGSIHRLLSQISLGSCRVGRKSQIASMLFDHCLDKAWVGIFSYDVCKVCNNLNVGRRNTDDKLGDAQCTAVDLFLRWGCCFDAAIARCSGSTGVLRMCGEPPEKLRNEAWHESETGQGPCILVAPGGLCRACARNPGFLSFFVHFLSFFVLSGFMFRGSDTSCKGPYKNLEPGGKASVNIRAKEALGSKQRYMFCIAFDVSFLILFSSRPAASLLTVSRCYAEQRSEGSVIRWCCFNTQPPF